jgi:hypothetical protein
MTQTGSRRQVRCELFLFKHDSQNLATFFFKRTLKCINKQRGPLLALYTEYDRFKITTAFLYGKETYFVSKSRTQLPIQYFFFIYKNLQPTLQEVMSRYDEELLQRGKNTLPLPVFHEHNFQFNMFLF